MSKGSGEGIGHSQSGIVWEIFLNIKTCGRLQQYNKIYHDGEVVLFLYYNVPTFNNERVFMLYGEYVIPQGKLHYLIKGACNPENLLLNHHVSSDRNEVLEWITGVNSSGRVISPLSVPPGTSGQLPPIVNNQDMPQ